MREFVEREIIPFTDEWDENKALPAGIFRKCFEAGALFYTPPIGGLFSFLDYWERTRYLLWT